MEQELRNETPNPSKDIQLIDVEKAKEMLGNPELNAVLADVRDKDAYEHSHDSQAVNLTAENFHEFKKKVNFN